MAIKCCAIFSRTGEYDAVSCHTQHSTFGRREDSYLCADVQGILNLTHRNVEEIEILFNSEVMTGKENELKNSTDTGVSASLFQWYVNLHGLFNAKVAFVEEQKWYYLPHSWG